MVVLILAGLAVGGAAQQEQVAEAGDGFKHLASQREQRGILPGALGRVATICRPPELISGDAGRKCPAA
jgi:hypothetical protein